MRILSASTVSKFVGAILFLACFSGCGGAEGSATSEVAASSLGGSQ